MLPCHSSRLDWTSAWRQHPWAWTRSDVPAGTKFALNSMHMSGPQKSSVRYIILQQEDPTSPIAPHTTETHDGIHTSITANAPSASSMPHRAPPTTPNPPISSTLHPPRTSTTTLLHSPPDHPALLLGRTDPLPPPKLVISAAQSRVESRYTIHPPRAVSRQPSDTNTLAEARAWTYIAESRGEDRVVERGS